MLEILAVTAILAVLLVLLVPVAGKMKNRADETRCLSQLRQWGLAINGYAQDNNNMVRYQRWFSVAGNESFYNPYFNSDKIYNPATGKSEIAQSVFRVCPAKRSLHTYLFVSGRYGNGSGGYSNGGVDTDGDGVVDSYNRAVMVRPSQFLQMMDTAPSSSSMIPYDPGVLDSKVMPMCIGPDKSLIRHGGRANALFGDGHVETIGWNDLDYSKAENKTKLDTWFNLN